MTFANRAEAGRRLAARLRHLGESDVVVLGLPRGGVPVAAEVAAALQTPLDVIVVRKLGVPAQPELGMGAIGEDGVRIVNRGIVAQAGVSDTELAEVERRERAELERRARRFRMERPRLDLAGRVAIIVDDGIATGSTARAACQVARAQGAARVVLAVPIAPADWTARMGDVADELVAVETPRTFWAIGQFYDDFTQTSDGEVLRCLERASRPERRSAADGTETVVQSGGLSLAGVLTVPDPAAGLVVFAHGSGSSRHSPRNRHVAHVLNGAGLATLLFDLLTPDEEHDRANVFDIELLARRLVGTIRWTRTRPGLSSLSLGLFGASTGAAAALWAAATPGADVAAVVSRGGRPDLAMAVLPAVTAPTLLIVGGRDEQVLELNRRALAALGCERRLEVIPGATHLFEEPGTLDRAAGLASGWFSAHLQPPG
jgi:putative phosphoribosyl transferase